MKVLHVIPSLSPAHGGPSFAMPLIERALAGVDVDVTVVTTDDDGPGKHLGVALGQELNGGFAKRFYFRKQTEFYKVSLPLRSWLDQHVTDYDLVHVHALFSFSSIAAARCAKNRGVPYIIRPLGVLNRYGMTRRRPGLKSLSFRFLEAPLLRAAAAIHYTSPQEKAEAETLFESRKQKVESRNRSTEAPKHRLSPLRPALLAPSSLLLAPCCPASVVIPLGIDCTPFSSLRSPNSLSLAPRSMLPAPHSSLRSPNFDKRWPVAAGRDIVLFLSRLDAVKGLDLLIDAFAEVRRRRPEALLVIAGTGEESFVNGLRKRAADLGIAEDILWTGFIDGADKLSALAAARVFVLPSYSENFGIAAVEALAAGVPTVLTQGVGIADQVRQSNAGLVVGKSAIEIAAAIQRLLSDADLARTLSTNAAQLARDHYSLEAMGAALKALYQSVLVSKSKEQRAKG